jgi:arylsulfatase A-like enzyme
MTNRYKSAKMPLPANFAVSHPFDHGNINGRDEQLLPVPRTEAAVKEELALYYAMITDMDAQLGRIMDALPANDETIVVFTSDQGLALGSHGLLGKQNCYEHSIRSPLIVCGPGLPQNERCTALVTLYDLFPTLCELSGLSIPATVTGKSLAPLLRHEKDRVHDFVTGMFTDSQRMICDERWKLIVYPHANKEQLFDLENDPLEQHSMTETNEHLDILKALRARLNSWRSSHADPNQP